MGLPPPTPAPSLPRRLPPVTPAARAAERFHGSEPAERSLRGSASTGRAPVPGSAPPSSPERYAVLPAPAAGALPRGWFGPWSCAAAPGRHPRAHVLAHCKPSAAETYRFVLDRHVLPAMGARAVGCSEIAALHHQLGDTSTMANAAIDVLSKMFSLDEAWERIPPGRNPCRPVHRYKTRTRERFLTPEEFRRLGRGSRDAETDGSVWPPAIAAIRLLLLTGCRHSETLTLRWDDVDRTTGDLRSRGDAKAGPRMVPLTRPLAVVLDSIARAPGNLWVVVGKGRNDRLTNLDLYRQPIRAKAGIEDVPGPRLEAFVCVEGAGPRREPVDGRQAVGPRQNRDDGALCASRA